MSSDIKVSVCVVTYNQEKYIAQCLQSLVDQKTDFPFEIIVGEDCSTDKTNEIVEDFACKYPDLIVRNYHKQNVGAVQNAITSYRMARGKYICHLDGDDYALPGKLQRQFYALENNVDCVICSHDMLLVNNECGELERTFRKHNKEINTLIDLYAQLPFFAHSSKMFVNDLYDDFWDVLHPMALDIEVHVQQAKKGSIYHINESLGIYRVLSGVSLQNKVINSAVPEGCIRIFENALRDKELDSDLIEDFYAKSMFEYAYQAAIINDKKSLVKYINLSLFIKKYSFIQCFFKITSFFPSLTVLMCKARSVLKGY